MTRLDIMRQAQNQMVQGAVIDFAALLEAAVNAHGRAEQDMLQVIAKTFSPLQQRHRTLFRDAHRDVGNAALRSTQQSFRQRRFKRPVAQYRSGQDRLSGRLSSALASNGAAHVRATASGLSFIDMGLMDKEAAHWRRLNFGAGGGSREGIIAPQQFQMSWQGVLIGTIGLQQQPSPAFRIPRGFWVGAGGEFVGANKSRLGQDQFFLPRMVPAATGRPSFARTPTGGIGSRNFLDAGVRRIANELPVSYAAVYDHLFRTAKADLQRVATRVGATVVTPTGANAPRHYRRQNRGNLGSRR